MCVYIYIGISLGFEGYKYCIMERLSGMYSYVVIPHFFLDFF